MTRERYSPDPTHGELEGLTDNDHTQYVNGVTDTASIDLTLAAQTISADVKILIVGTAQGQMLFWDNTLGQWVPAETSEIFWDDTNKRLGINNSSPTSELDVSGTVTSTRILAGGITE